MWIPELYNGRDKTHYFINFEGTQIRGESFARAIVPTELERRGDFSQIDGSPGAARSRSTIPPRRVRAAAASFEMRFLAT